MNICTTSLDLHTTSANIPLSCFLLQSLPYDLLAEILSNTDGESVQNVLCVSRQVCDLVKLIQSSIRLENGLRKFIEKLPVVKGAQNEVQEENLQIFQNVGQNATIEQHNLHKRGAVFLSKQFLQYTSIRCPAQAHLIILSVGGMQIVRLDASTLRLMRAEEYIDLMDFIRYLPALTYHEIRIDYDVGMQDLSLYTTHVPFSNPMPQATWKLSVISPAYDKLQVRHAHHMSCPLYSNHMSLGHVVLVEHEGKAVTDLVKTFSLTIDNVVCDISAPWCRVQNIPAKLFNCPVPLRDCYYIQMSEKVNCSRIDRLLLNIHFYQEENVTVTICNLHSNYARTLSGMMGLAFSN